MQLEAINSVEVYSAAQMTWSYSVPLNTSLAAPAVIGAGREVIVIGGLLSVNMPPSNAVLAFNSSFKRGGWITTGAMLTGRSAAAAAMDGPNVYVAGGYGAANATGVLASVETAVVTDGGIGKWNSVSSLSQARAGAAMTYFNGSLYCIGGVDEAGTALSSVERFDGRLGRCYVVSLLHPELFMEVSSVLGSNIVLRFQNLYQPLLHTRIGLFFGIAFRILHIHARRCV